MSNEMFGSVGQISNLTEKQILFWLGNALQEYGELDTDATTYVFEMKTALDTDVFRLAFESVVEETDALKFLFRQENGYPIRSLQVASATGSIQCVALEHPLVEPWIESRAQRPLNTSVRVFDASLIQSSAGCSFFVFKYHHIIGDAQSVHLFFRKVEDHYRAIEASSPVPKTFAASFDDFVTFERVRRASPEVGEAKAFWSSRLKGVQGSPGGIHTTSVSRFKVDKNLGQRIVGLCKEYKLRSPAVFFAAALFLQLRSRSKDDRVRIGMNFKDRPTEFQNTFGLFVSTCPLQADVSAGMTFLSLCRNVQSEIGLASAHTQTLVPNPLNSRVWSVLFNYLNLRFDSFAGIPVSTRRILSTRSNKELSFQMNTFAGSDSFEVSLHAATEIHSAESVAKWISDYNALILYFAQNIEASVKDSGASIAPMVCAGPPAFSMRRRGISRPV
jgi:Condensation domain